MPSQTARPALLQHLLLTLLVLTCLAGCGKDPVVRQESFVFGTRVEIVSYGAPEPEATAALNEVLREFDRLHRTYHAWQTSELTRLNDAIAAGKPAPISPEMRELLTASQQYAELGNGLFDPAIGKLIGLWGFHGDSFAPHLPDPAALQALVAAAPSVRQLQIDADQVRSSNRAVELDFGGIAKGYALDRAATILHQHGIKNALINIGGNVMALGAKGKQPWVVGIQHPRASGSLASLALYDGEAIGTSGDYQRYFEYQGQRYSHLIDPRSGSPAHHTAALTVLVMPGEHAGMLSDVASKPLFMAADAWPGMARRFGIRHALRVDAEGNISLTPDMRARLRWAEGVGPATVVE